MKSIFILWAMMIVQLAGQAFIHGEICKNPGSFRYHNHSAEAQSDDSVDVKFYSLNLVFETNPVYIRGNVEIMFASKSANLTQVKIDLSNAMTVDSVYEGINKISFAHASGQITANLTSAMALNERRSITFYYRGLPVPTGFGSFGYASSGSPFIWTLSQPYGAKDWWACKNSPDDKADSVDINITTQAGLKVVSNGLLNGIVNNNDGTETHRWKTRYPVSSYLIAVTISDFNLYSNYFKYSATDSMRVDHYLPADILALYKLQLDKTPNMLSVFSQKYGEYPFIKEKYGHVLFGRGGGMEHQTISSMGGFSDYLMAHELAHQWFGDKITCRDWNNIWLNEGFATYSEALYFESTGGAGSYRYYMDQKMNIAKNAVGSVYVNTNLADPYYIFDYARTYAKGGVILHMLRGVLGDSLFFKAIKEYAENPLYTYSTVITDEFRKSVEHSTGISLSYFFDQWVFGSGYPTYKLDWSKRKIDDGLWAISLLISQSSANIFKMPVKVKISTETGDKNFDILFDSKDEMFVFVIGSEPKEFYFDPDNYVLKEIESETKPGYEAESKEFILRQNYPNPFTESTTIRLVVNAGGNYRVKIYNALGEECGALYSGYMPAGIYPFVLSGKEFNLSGGVYFVRAENGRGSEWVKVVYLN